MTYRTLFLLLSCLCFGLTARSQNLVKNGGFENYTFVPGSIYFEDEVHDWYAYFSTPDFYTLDAMDSASLLDYCGTLPRTGRSFAGGYEYGYFPDMDAYNREFMQGELSEPLKAGKLYYAEMYVKPMLKSPVINWSINTLGMAFTDKIYNHYDSTVKLLIPEVPEVEYSGLPITDRNEWTKVSGCFKASGGETRVIVGNFRKDEDCDTLLIPGATGQDQWNYYMSYYLFDDILVKEMPDAYILPGDTVICRDSPITLTAYPAGAAHYTWSTGATTRSIQTGKEGVYSVDIISEEGCSLSASAKINTRFCGPVCPDLYIPNAFSPNGDGLNDEFGPSNANDQTRMELNIYNRWGQRVYYATGLGSKWDGRFREQYCDAGTYYYYVRYEDCHGAERTKKGDLLLVR